MPKPLANERPTASGEVQTEMDGLHYNFGFKRQNLSPTEVATFLGCSDMQVRNFVEEGLLSAASIGVGPVVRDHIRIARFSVCALWRERSCQKNGVELPWYQSPEVLFWRDHLRSKTPTPSNSK